MSATIGARLVNDGTLITAGNFDETFQSTHSITKDKIYADEFDEITLSLGAPSGGSIEFDGSSQYLTVNSSTEFQFGTNDFTIEGWFFLHQLETSNTYTRLWCFPDGDNVEILGSTVYYWNGTTTASSGSGVFHQNQWHHVALVKHNGTATVYVNGTSVITDVAPYNSTVSRPLAIGGEVVSGADGFLDGYVTNFRVVKGTAVYTANFNMPTSPLTAITNTQLLLLATTKSSFLTDSSTNNTTVVNHGGAFFTSWTPLVTVFNGVMKQLRTGSLQVANEIDEITVL